MLLAEEAPTHGNETLFADCVAAYEALPPELSERIAALQVIHDPNGGKVTIDGESRGRGEGHGLPFVTHPLVNVHPVTGRMALYGFSGTAAGIVGMEEPEAIGLLLEIKTHVLRDEFRQSAKAESGSILMWDNYSVIHSATPTEYSDEAGKRRLLYRISTRGVPAGLAHQQGVAPS
jgi:alpha-ketoglutarate-dependent taurine dioxygenase